MRICPKCDKERLSFDADGVCYVCKLEKLKKEFEELLKEVDKDGQNNS